MVSHSGISRHQRDDLRSHLQRLDGTEAQPLKRRNRFEYLSKELEQRSPWGPIAAIGAEMDPRQHHFLIAPGYQPRNFFDDTSRGQAAASPANRGNDAKRTVRIAPVLHFYDSARAATGSEMGLRLQLALQKDIAAENFRAST